MMDFTPLVALLMRHTGEIGICRRLRKVLTPPDLRDTARCMSRAVRDGWHARRLARAPLEWSNQSITRTDRKTVSRTFDHVPRRCHRAAKAQGFGVLSDIDVQATLKSKIGADMPKYRNRAEEVRRILFSAISAVGT